MIQLTSSIISSTISTCIVYPGERIKIEMHLDKEKKLKDTRDAIRKLYEKHGIKGFYQGLNSQIFGNGLSYAIYFVAYAKAKQFYGFDPNSFMSMVKSSGTAGCIASIATNPFWVLKTLQAKKSQSITTTAKELLKNEGLLSLWKGLTASLILVSNPIIQFAVYEFLKKKQFLKKDHVLFDLMIFIIGAISKIIATIITYPYTLIRTRQQSSKDGHSLFQTFLEQIEKNGFFGLFSGINAKIVQSVLNAAILLMAYERTQIILTKFIGKK